MADIAFLGLGRMGAAMAARLIAAGQRVIVWNRSEQGYARLRAELADGTRVEVAATPADAARQSDLVLTMLADAPAGDAVLFGPDGLINGLRPGSTVVDMATTGVAAARKISDRLDAVGAVFADGPVSGSVAAARAGELLVMVGGPQHVADRLRLDLAPVARAVVRVGDCGAGQAMKLSVNAVVHTTNGSISEALILAERGGVDRTVAYEIFEASVIGSRFLAYKRLAFEDPTSAAVAMTINLVAKDLDLIERFAASCEARMPLAATAHQVAADAAAAGLGERDMAVIADYHRRNL